MKQHLIKVFGERNTGTRALLAMIRDMPNLSTNIPDLRETPQTKDLKKRIKDRLRGKWLGEYIDALNFDNRNRVGGVASWKHSAPLFDQSFAAAQSHVIYVARNPYSWLISLYKKPYHVKGISCTSLEQFIDFPWMTIPKDRVDAVLKSPMCLWNEKLRAYTKFKNCCDIPNFQFKFEDFVLEPVATLASALDHFGIDPTGLAALPFSVKDHHQSMEDLQDYYRQEKWRSKLSRQSVILINHYTDWDIAKQFGYQMFDPKDFPVQIPAKYQTEFPVDFSTKP